MRAALASLRSKKSWQQTGFPKSRGTLLLESILVLSHFWEATLNPIRPLVLHKELLPELLRSWLAVKVLKFSCHNMGI